LRTTFILFVSSGLGICDRLNSQWRLRHSGFIGKELNAVWLISVLLHLMSLVNNPVRLMVPKIRYMFCGTLGFHGTPVEE